MKIQFLLIFLILVPVSFAWNCKTHQFICDKIGQNDSNCCIADDSTFQKTHTSTNPYYHHCTNNYNNCDARLVANTYMKKTDNESKSIYLHLLADSLTPVHWYNTDYYKCHKPFEDMIDSNLGSNNWKVDFRCQLSNGSVYRIEMDSKYLDYVGQYIKNYTQGLPANKTSQYLKIETCSAEECSYKISKWEIILVCVLIFVTVVILFLKIKPSRILSHLEF